MHRDDDQVVNDPHEAGPPGPKGLVTLVVDPLSWRSPDGPAAPLAGALAATSRERAVTCVGLSGQRSGTGTSSTPAPAGWAVHDLTVPADTLADALGGCVERTLWPLYHDLVDRVVFKETWWMAYESLNAAFADHTAIVAPHGAQVWVHDLALQLVPGLLRLQRPDLEIGMYLPAPFPPPDAFRRLPWRRQIVNHLLQAELVGFPDADSARHFTTCASLFGGLSGARGAKLEVGNHRCRVEVHPLGIAASDVQHQAEDPAVVEAAKELRRELGSPTTVLASLETAGHSSGADLALGAVHRAFARGELEPAKTTLVHIRPAAGPPGGSDAERAKVNFLIDALSAEFGRLGRPVVHTVNAPLTRTATLALYRAVDLLLLAPRREGISLEALDYVASRVDNGGGLILSEFSATTRLLDTADVVNPFDVAEFEFAIGRSLRRSPADRARRMTQLRRIVHRTDRDRTFAGFLGSLARVSRG